MVPTQSLLKRQLKRFFGNDFSIPAEWDGFLAAVDSAYTEFVVAQERRSRAGADAQATRRRFATGRNG
jgi:hypothetical protein